MTTLLARRSGAPGSAAGWRGLGPSSTAPTRTRRPVASGQSGPGTGIVRAVDTSDAALAARMAAGDDEALAEVWQRYGPLVFGHARRLTGSSAVAEDVAQEVFVTLWQHPERFDPRRGSLRAYLGVHAHRRAIDALRRDGRRVQREQRHLLLGSTGSSTPDPSAERAQLSEAVRHAIRRLPVEQRRAVELAYFGGLTHREVASTLGVPEGTVKSRAARPGKAPGVARPRPAGAGVTMPHDAPNPVDELRYALAQADAMAPPDALGEGIVVAALSIRPPGRPVDEPDAIGPVEAFGRAVASFDALLGSLGPDEWHVPALRGLDVQGLVGHLIGVERDFATTLVADAPAAEADHVASTEPVSAAQRDRPAGHTHREWRGCARRTLADLARVEADPGGLDAVVGLHGLRMALGPLLIVRTFELWTHEEDIRRATGRALRAPDGASLRLMTDLAITLLPGVAATTGDVGRSARIVLTGAGGGTWQTALTGTPGVVVPEGPVDVRIVMDAVEFCRLAANRVDPSAPAADVTGDDALAHRLFAGVAALALD